MWFKHELTGQVLGAVEVQEVSHLQRPPICWFLSNLSYSYTVFMYTIQNTTQYLITMPLKQKYSGISRLKLFLKLSWCLVTFYCFLCPELHVITKRQKEMEGKPFEKSEGRPQKEINSIHRNVMILKRPTRKTAEIFCLLLTNIVAIASGYKNY